VIKGKYPFRVHGIATFTYREDNGILSIKRRQYSAIKISLVDVMFFSRLKIRDMEELVDERALLRHDRNTICSFIVALKQGRVDLKHDLGISLKH
jgi:hypothetical protein